MFIKTGNASLTAKNRHRLEAMRRPRRRSASAAFLLKNAGIRVQLVEGGINAWPDTLHLET